MNHVNAFNTRLQKRKLTQVSSERRESRMPIKNV